MFVEFMNKNEFYEKYMLLFSTRFTVGSLEVEDSEFQLTEPKDAIKIYNNMLAFNSLIEKGIDKMTMSDIININNMVNKGLNYFQPGFRRVQVDVRGADFFPTAPNLVPMEMYTLFDNYYNIWNDLSVYEREAKFHIKFIRIHPFEDGNGRTGRIIMNYNLCRQNKAPIIIDSDERKEYFDYIGNYDEVGFAKFIEKKSNEELETMIEFYENICGDSLTEEEVESDEDVKIAQLRKQYRSC